MAAIFQTIFSNAFSWMKIYEFLLIHLTLFVRYNWQYNIPALVQIMAWRRSGDKPLSEPMMVSSLTHISFMISQIRLSGVSNSNQWHYSFELLVAYIPIHDIYNLIMSITGIANSSLMYICIKLLISLNDIRNIISILMDRLNQVRHISNHNYVWRIKWRIKSLASRLFTQPFIQKQIKEDIKTPRHWPLCGEFTGDRWIPRTNGQ